MRRDLAFLECSGLTEHSIVRGSADEMAFACPSSVFDEANGKSRPVRDLNLRVTE